MLFRFKKCLDSMYSVCYWYTDRIPIHSCFALRSKMHDQIRYFCAFIVLIGSLLRVESQNLQSGRFPGVFSQSLRTESQPTVTSGYVYYNFYPDTSCNGQVTYQTGVAAGTCLPSRYYGIPYNDTYEPDFQSFRVMNLNGKFFLHSDGILDH